MSSVNIPALLVPVVSALASLPPKQAFADTPQGKAFASLDAATLATLAEIVQNARLNWEKENLSNPTEELEIACAHLLAGSVGASELGKVLGKVTDRYHALVGLSALTEKDVKEALVAGKGDSFELLAQVFARSRLAKEPVSTAEAVRMAKLAPSSYAPVNKWLAVGIQVERVDTEGKKTVLSVDTILASAARKWAKANGFEVTPPPAPSKANK
jgi:hypothetical protein